MPWTLDSYCVMPRIQENFWPIWPCVESGQFYRQFHIRNILNWHRSCFQLRKRVDIYADRLIINNLKICIALVMQCLKILFRSECTKISRLLEDGVTLKIICPAFIWLRVCMCPAPDSMVCMCFWWGCWQANPNSASLFTVPTHTWWCQGRSTCVMIRKEYSKACVAVLDITYNTFFQQLKIYISQYLITPSILGWLNKYFASSWLTTRWLDGTPTTEVTPVTIW